MLVSIFIVHHITSYHHSPVHQMYEFSHHLKVYNMSCLVYTLVQGLISIDSCLNHTLLLHTVYWLTWAPDVVSSLVSLPRHQSEREKTAEVMKINRSIHKILYLCYFYRLSCFIQFFFLCPQLLSVSDWHTVRWIPGVTVLYIPVCWAGKIQI